MFVSDKLRIDVCCCLIFAALIQCLPFDFLVLDAFSFQIGNDAGCADLILFDGVDRSAHGAVERRSFFTVGVL